jgi:hypothetical protein
VDQAVEAGAGIGGDDPFSKVGLEFMTDHGLPHARFLPSFSKLMIISRF